MDISVIIVSYNVRHYLRQCLESVRASAAASGRSVEVYVVDNNSADGTIDYIRAAFPPAAFPNLHIIANRCNVGFGRANNQAVRKSKGRYVLFLNPDTIITEDTLRDSFEFAEAHKNVGAIGVKMLSGEGTFSPESRRGLPTPWVAFCKMSGLGRLFPKSRVFGRYYMKYLDLNAPAEIEIVSGAYMFCSRQALNKCGSFDEKFFMYGEDIDLSFRFLKNGFHNWYIPSSIIHYKGESTHKGSYQYVHTFYEAMLIFFKKHFPTTRIALSVPIKLAILSQACLALVNQRMKSFFHYLNPASANKILKMKYADEDSVELDELAEEWGIDIADAEADIVTYNAEAHSYREVIGQIEGTHRQLGMYYPSLGTLILASGIYD